MGMPDGFPTSGKMFLWTIDVSSTAFFLRLTGLSTISIILFLVQAKAQIGAGGRVLDVGFVITQTFS
jgi:hypothetical protein